MGRRTGLGRPHPSEITVASNSVLQREQSGLREEERAFTGGLQVLCDDPHGPRERWGLAHKYGEHPIESRAFRLIHLKEFPMKNKPAQQGR